MAKSTRQAGRAQRTSVQSEVVVVGLVVASAVVVDPFGFQAFLLLRYAVTLFFLLGAVVVMWQRGVSLPAQRSAQIAILAFLGLVFVSSVLARAPLVAIAGAAGRQLGWLAWVLFVVAFIAGLSLFDRSERGRVETALVVGFAIAILGVGVVAALELVGSPLVSVNQQFGSRLQASFGNPAVLGAFGVLGLPVVAGGFVARRFPLLTGSASLIGAALLVLSGARGAWVGFAAGAVFVGVSVTFRRSSRSFVVVAVITAAVVALLGATVLTGRWGSAVSGFEGRVATWEVAARVVGDNAVVGVGPEGFATAFTEAVDDYYVIRYTRDDTIDRAHNGILEVATTVGIPGLLVYLALVAGVFVVAWKAVRAGDAIRPVIAGAAVGIVAYLVQQQVFFQLAVLDLTFWLVVGLLAATAGMATKRRRMPALTIAMFVVVGLTWVYTAVGVYADHQDQAALQSNDPEYSMSRLEHAASLRPPDDVHAMVGARIAGTSEGRVVNGRAGRLIDRALSMDATNGDLIFQRSGLLVDVYEASGSVGALDAARVDLEGLVARDRTNGEAFLRLGAIAYYQSDWDAAREYWLRSAHLMPHRREPVDNLKVLEAR